MHNVTGVTLDELEQMADEYMDLIGSLPPDPPELETVEIDCWTGQEEVPVRKHLPETIIPPSRR